MRTCLALGTELLLPRREREVDDQEDAEDEHERDRHGSAEGPALCDEELISDGIADELALAAPEQRGDHVLACHRDEHEQGTGHEPRQAEWERDLPEGLER